VRCASALLSTERGDLVWCSVRRIPDIRMSEVEVSSSGNFCSPPAQESGGQHCRRTQETPVPMKLLASFRPLPVAASRIPSVTERILPWAGVPYGIAGNLVNRTPVRGVNPGMTIYPAERCRVSARLSCVVKPSADHKATPSLPFPRGIACRASAFG
jgi:hypothetical protein